MSKTVLIMHPDVEMILEIQDQLYDVAQRLGIAVTSRRARSQAEARARAGEDEFDLIITETEIPPGDMPTDAAGERVHRGLTTIRELREKRPDLEAILITGHVDDAVFEFSQTEDVGLVREGGGFREGLEAQIRERLGGETSTGKNCFDLEIALAPDGAGCSYQFQQEGQPCHTSRRLSVDTDELLKLVRKSRRVHIDEPEWEEDLREIGEELAEQLFLQRTPDNLRFLEEFNQKVGEVKGIDNIRIRFVVDSELHPIAFEALKRKGQDYLMLSTPIYRRIDNRSDILCLNPQQLFQDDESRQRPVNVLIIEANVPPGSYVNDDELGLHLPLEPLDQLEQEVNQLTTRLETFKKNGGRVGKVKVIREEDVPPDRSFAKCVEATLREGHWHIVHYGGHTHYDPKNSTGYVFFPGSGIQAVEPITIDLFAMWLRSSTRFVFLSSCTSAEEAFMFRLVKEGVPAILGFLWKVEDKMAREFAMCFYDRLFQAGGQSLEYACLQAKKEMHAVHVNNPIWAAPVLVVQANYEKPRFAA